MKINLGAGNDIQEGYINIDSRNLPGIDVVRNILSTNWDYDNIVDEVLASDIIEHFTNYESSNVLQRIYRWLKIGGKVIIKVPNLSKICLEIFHDIDVEKNIMRIYGGQDYPENFHKFGFTKKTMTKELERLGFKNIKISDGGIKDEYNFIVEAEK